MKEQEEGNGGEESRRVPRWLDGLLAWRASRESHPFPSNIAPAGFLSSLPFPCPFLIPLEMLIEEFYSGRLAPRLGFPPCFCSTHDDGVLLYVAALAWVSINRRSL